MNCQTCKHNKVCNEKRFADECYAFKPQTEADRIRAMTDEELARLFIGIEAHKVGNYNTSWLDWLKEEATE